MSLVPYVPTPLPDEILGSWLARVLLHNGKGAWNALLRDCGYTEAFGAVLFDLIDFDEKLDKVLRALGTTYEKTLLSMTTLPYWLAFASSTDPTPLPGTTATRAPLNTRGDKIDCLRVFGLKRTHGQATSPRFCPQCLSEDQENHGEVYWHRSHQLPNVFFCYKHDCELHDRCPKCEARTLAPMRQLMPLPKLVCECGHRLDSIEPGAQTSEPRLRFAKLSAAALLIRDPVWSRVHVVAQLKHWFSGDLRREHGKFINLLRATFGDDPSAAEQSQALQFTTKITSNTKTFYFRENPSTGSAPDFCALLVAMNKSLSEAVSAFKETRRQMEQETSTVRRASKAGAQKKGSSPVKRTGQNKIRVQLERCLALTQAFHKTMSSPELPQLMNAGTLGRLAGLRPEQAHSVLRSHKFLRDAIIDANADLPKRRVLWAVSVLRSKGERITKSKIREIAAIHSGSESDEILKFASVDNGLLMFG